MLTSVHSVQQQRAASDDPSLEDLCPLVESSAHTQPETALLWLPLLFGGHHSDKIAPPLEHSKSLAHAPRLRAQLETPIFFRDFF